MTMKYLPLLLLLCACTASRREGIIRSVEVGYYTGSTDMEGPEGGQFDGDSHGMVFSVQPFADAAPYAEDDPVVEWTPPTTYECEPAWKPAENVVQTSHTDQPVRSAKARAVAAWLAATILALTLGLWIALNLRGIRKRLASIGSALMSLRWKRKR